MRSFMYTIRTPVGMHARHAGLLVREAQKYQADITVTKGENSANAKGILALMKLGIKQGDVIGITINGEDEDAAAVELHSFIWTHF